MSAVRAPVPTATIAALVKSADPILLYRQIEDRDQALLTAGRLLFQELGCPPGVKRCPDNCSLCWWERLLSGELEGWRRG